MTVNVMESAPLDLDIYSNRSLRRYCTFSYTFLMRLPALIRGRNNAAFRHNSSPMPCNTMSILRRCTVDGADESRSDDNLQESICVFHFNRCSQYEHHQGQGPV